MLYPPASSPMPRTPRVTAAPSVYKQICKSVPGHRFLAPVTAPSPTFLKQNHRSALMSHQPPVYFYLVFSDIFLKQTVCAGCCLTLATSSHYNLVSHHQGTETMLQAVLNAFCYPTLQRCPISPRTGIPNYALIPLKSCFSDS